METAANIAVNAIAVGTLFTLVVVPLFDSGNMKWVSVMAMSAVIAALCLALHRAKALVEATNKAELVTLLSPRRHRASSTSGRQVPE